MGRGRGEEVIEQRFPGERHKIASQPIAVPVPVTVRIARLQLFLCNRCR